MLNKSCVTLAEKAENRGLRKHKNSVFNVDVEVKNFSGENWISSGSTPVFLCYHWLDADWNVLVYDGLRTALPGGGIENGKTVAHGMGVNAPSRAGVFYLVLTLVQESVRWMECDLDGFAPAVVRVVVDDLEARTRIVIVSSPRSGNTWLNRMLSQVWDVPVFAVHRPTDLDWENLPERCVIQLHWTPSPEFCALMLAHELRPLVLVRHPLDVLISILHFCRHEPQTAQWLDGEGGTEDSITSCSPVDQAFQAYATGPRARALISLSSTWLEYPGVIVVRYEDLASRPDVEIVRIAREASLSVTPTSVREVVEKNRIEKARVGSTNKHFWQGKAGLWRSLITAESAFAIYEAHRETFERTGYGIEPDQALSSEAARSNWSKVAISRS
jgi:hypothetical protein